MTKHRSHSAAFKRQITWELIPKCLLSLAAVRGGMDWAAVAKIGSMDRQTLRDWVHRFNVSLWRCGRLSFFSFANILPTFEGGRLRTWNQYGGAEL